MKRQDNTLWVEKYRPTNLDSYVTDITTYNLFKRYINSQDIDNLLLCGVNGTGKTSAAKLLASNVESDSIYINASSERGIDVIRERIEGFAMTMSSSNLKIVILDEADGLLPASQQALRPIMEIYSKHVRFILTCNYPEKIIDPLKSRCTVIRFEAIKKGDIMSICADILDNEKVTFEESDLKLVINTYYPDIRKVIRELQRYTEKNVLSLPSELTSSISSYTPIRDILLANTSKSWVEIRQYIADNNIRIFEPVYSYLYEEIDKFPAKKIPDIIMAISESQYQATFVVDKEITFMACMASILS